MKKTLSFSFLLALLFSCTSGETVSDTNQSNGGSTNGGSTSGGSTSGGSTNGGSTNGGSTNGGSTSGGSTNGGSTSNNGQTFAELNSKAARIYVDYVDACCSLDPAFKQALLAEAEAEGNELGYDPITEGFVSINQAALSACLDESERLAQSCGVRPFDGVSACQDSPFIPLRNEGESCAKNVNGELIPFYEACTAGLYCAYETGLCTRKNGLGEACDDFDNCGENLLCNSSSVCEQGIAQGGACDENNDKCAGENYCNQGICVSYESEDFEYAQMPMTAEECAEFTSNQ